MNFLLKLTRMNRILSPNDGENDGSGSSSGDDRPKDVLDDSTKEDDVSKKAKGAVNFYKEQAEKYKSDLSKMQEQFEQLNSKLGETEEKTLREQSKWQELADKYKKDLENERSNYSNFKKGMIEFEKINAVKHHAMKAGILDSSLEDLSLLTLDGVEIEQTTNGRILINGADKFIESLKDRRPHWFKNSNRPNLDNGLGGDFTLKELSIDDISKLKNKDPAAYKKEMQKFLDKRNKRI